MVVDTLLVLDNLFHRAIVIANVAVAPDVDDAELERRIAAAEARCDEWLEPARGAERRWRRSTIPAARPLATATSRVSPTPTSSATCERCQEYIAAGDAFQIVLSRRLDVTPAPDPFLSLSLAPRAQSRRRTATSCDSTTSRSPARRPKCWCASSTTKSRVRPIAGTRPRGATPEADPALEAEMRADPKERAEHLMLLDLGRNDVGRVAQYGSVRVVEQMVVERYSHVMHLVSEVRGTLRPELDALDALAAAFPAGTVSGAPKVRAMEIIDELEVTRRGPYAGAVGYVGFGARNLDTAIAIRTIVFHGGTAYVQAGAGIVAGLGTRGGVQRDSREGGSDAGGAGVARNSDKREVSKREGDPA